MDKRIVMDSVWNFVGANVDRRRLKCIVIFRLQQSIVDEKVNWEVDEDI